MYITIQSSSLDLDPAVHASSDSVADSDCYGMLLRMELNMVEEHQASMSSKEFQHHAVLLVSEATICVFYELVDLYTNTAPI